MDTSPPDNYKELFNRIKDNRGNKTELELLKGRIDHSHRCGCLNDAQFASLDMMIMIRLAMLV
jgi:hypothetical protein